MSTSRLNREVAWRVFSKEFNDADYSFKEGEDERAPNYLVTPTAAKINRLFVVGVLTESENVGSESDFYRARVSDSFGAFSVEAGQYQMDAMQFLSEVNPPQFIAVVGKARTFRPDDSDEVYTSIRPEEINVVDEETRDIWNIQTAERTLQRIDDILAYLDEAGTGETVAALHPIDDTLTHYELGDGYYRGLREDVIDLLVDYSDADKEEIKASTGDSDTGFDESEFEDVDHEEVESIDVDEPEWEMSEDRKQEVEAEFGTEFEQADEISEDEAETEGAEDDEEEVIEEPPDIEEEDEADEIEEETEEGDVEEIVEEEETETEEDAEEEETESDEDAEELVLGIIEEHEDSGGIHKDDVLDEAEDRGVSRDIADSAVENLLMDGLCYPSDDDKIKPL